MKSAASYILIGLSSLLLIACSSPSNDSRSAAQGNNNAQLREKTAAMDDVDVPAQTQVINHVAALPASAATDNVEERKKQQYGISIQPTTVNSDWSAFSGIPNTKPALAQAFTHEIISQLTNTHKFIVLAKSDSPATPEKLKNQVATQPIIVDDTIPSEEEQPAAAKLPENSTISIAAGADYLVISYLDHLSINRTIKTIKATGRDIETKTLFAVLNYQMIDNKTQQIIAAKTIRYESNLASTISVKQAVEQAIVGSVEILKNSIIDQLYPIKIVTVSENKQAILNQSLPIGTICSIFSPGEKVYDTDNNLFLGYDQTRSGSVKVIHNTATLSFATIVSGYAAKGDICQRQLIEEVRKPEMVKQTAQGGVILPFD